MFLRNFPPSVKLLHASLHKNTLGTIPVLVTLDTAFLLVYVTGVSVCVCAVCGWKAHVSAPLQPGAVHCES